MIYTNALEYYSQVQDAAKRRIDSAESLYAELHDFFRNMGQHETGLGMAAPTQKKTKRDANALMKGKSDWKSAEGEIIIRNISPKIIGGTHEVIDETFKNSAAFKESEEGRIR
jgi:inhibitor of KinA sporulation pathway (predicted exonuclease)